MSLHVSLVMIEGDHRDRMTEIFTLYDYPVTGRTERASTIANAFKVMEWPQKGRPDTIMYKCVCYCDGWTIIIDPELILFAEESACEKVARLTGSRLFGMICEGASSTYGYIVYNPSKTRSLLVVGDIIEDNFGKRLAVEEGIAFATLTESSVLDVTRGMGFDYAHLEKVSEFTLYELDVSESPDEPAVQSHKRNAESPKKAWWRFW